MAVRASLRPGVALVVALAAAAATAPAAAQGPEADWRTIETAHFRVHFPAAAEPWSARLAARLEAVREAVVAEVGYAPPQVVDVVVADPAAQANGSAWPLLGAPRMALWTTPPSAASALGQLGDWGELLVVHEYAHLAHLLRPSRHPLRARLEPWPLPLGPLATGAPRWAIEGYATLVEGRLTGSGRPHSAFRAAVLRQWARQGRLPSYGRLASDRDGFLGMSMAYLGGSAFLEWLERREGVGDDALPRLWAAATARAARGFEAAFERVFGDRPAALWARFSAETTADALAQERREAALARQGELWLDRDGATDELALSPDGRRLAALVTDRRRPPRLVVWDLAAPGSPADGEPAAAAADPDDPAPLPRAPRTRPPAHQLELAPGATPTGGRFLADGRLLVGLLAPDRQGFRHGELALWTPGERPRRLTHRGDLRDADPLPGGRQAVAVRWRDGGSGLVVVDLATGAVSELAPTTTTSLHDRPRVAPAGDALAWLEHRDGRWRARVAPLGAGPALGPARELEPPGGGEPVDLAWRGDGSLLYATVARGDELEIEALPVAAGARAHQVTRGAGASLAPAPTPDGTTLYYLALDADGLDVRRLPLDAATVQLEIPAGAAPEAAPAVAFEPSPPPPPPRSLPYGGGRAEWSPLAAGWLGDEDGTFEAGARGGDLLGRWELLVLGALGGDESPQGGALRLAARPLPATLSLALAGYRETAADAGAPGEREVAAAELAARRELVWGAARLDAGGGVGWARTASVAAGNASFERGSAFLDLDLARAFRRGRARLDARVGLGLAHGFADSEARHERLALALSGALPAARVGVAWERRRARGELGPGERLALGGFSSSLAPPSARPGRIDHPALAPATLAGVELETQRVALSAGSLPVALFAERHRADEADWLELWGLEVRFRTAPLPFLGLPGLSASAGVARVEAGPAGGDDTRAWLGLVFPSRPGAVGAPLGPSAALDFAP